MSRSWLIALDRFISVLTAKGGNLSESSSSSRGKFGAGDEAEGMMVVGVVMHAGRERNFVIHDYRGGHLHGQRSSGTERVRGD